jgi:hypothetical protein
MMSQFHRKQKSLKVKNLEHLRMKWKSWDGRMVHFNILLRTWKYPMEWIMKSWSRSKNSRTLKQIWWIWCSHRILHQLQWRIITNWYTSLVEFSLGSSVVCSLQTSFCQAKKKPKSKTWATSQWTRINTAILLRFPQQLQLAVPAKGVWVKMPLTEMKLPNSCEVLKQLSQCDPNWSFNNYTAHNNPSKLMTTTLYCLNDLKFVL